MAWLPLHNEPERALAEEWLSWLDEGDRLRDDRFEAVFQSAASEPGSPVPVLAARLVRGALLAWAFSGINAWLDRGVRFASSLQEVVPSETESMSLTDLAEIQQAFCLAWMHSREDAWRDPMLGLAETLRTRLETDSGVSPLTDRAARVAAVARVARTAMVRGDDDLMNWAGERITVELAAVLPENGWTEPAEAPASDPDLAGMIAWSRILRALAEVDACVPGFAIAESLPALYRRFREAATPLDEPRRLKEVRRDPVAATAWCEAQVETMLCHAAMIEKFPAAARLAWLGLRRLWWTWRDPGTWWLRPACRRWDKGISPDSVSPTLLLYAGLPEYLLGMRHCTQPLFE